MRVSSRGSAHWAVGEVQWLSGGIGWIPGEWGGLGKAREFWSGVEQGTWFSGGMQAALRSFGYEYGDLAQCIHLSFWIHWVMELICTFQAMESQVPCSAHQHWPASPLKSSQKAFSLPLGLLGRKMDGARRGYSHSWVLLSWEQEGIR